VSATTPNPDTVAAFAAQRSTDGALTVMVIAKSLSGSTPTTITLANAVQGGTAQAWQLTAANAITRLPDVGVSGSSFAVTLPPQSITLFVVANASGPPGAPTNLRIQ
jgi:O-glycosyl hydrolase